MPFCFGFAEYVSIDSGQKEMRIFFLISKKDLKISTAHLSRKAEKENVQ